MGVPFEYIKKGLEKVTVPGRAEVLDIKKDYTVMIDYAHSPDSLENILTTVKAYAPGRVVVYSAVAETVTKPKDRLWAGYRDNWRILQS